MAIELLVALALVAANGFFVATEFSLTRVRPTQIDAWEREGRAGAGSVRHGVEHIDSYLAACQLGITLASIGLGVVGKPVFRELLEPLLGDSASIAGFGVAATLAFLVITMLHVVVGELSPKSLAIARTGRTALAVAPFMRAFYLATRPLVDLFNAMGNLLLKPFGIPPAREAGHAPHSEEELHSLVRASSDQGVLEREEGTLTKNALAFDERRAREVMRPRPHVVTVDVTAGADGVLAAARESGFSRFPVVEEPGDLDTAIGIVHVKAVALAPGRVDLRELAQPAPHVPEAASLTAVLHDLRRERRQLALVVDEHGTVVGMVSLEDLMEALVGDIEDEFDTAAEELIRPEGEDTVVAGSAPLSLLSERLGLAFGDARDATIGGLVVERLGRLPEPGETVPLDGFCAEVVATGDGRVLRLRLSPRHQTPG